jgi:hypothetical protein
MWRHTPKIVVLAAIGALMLIFYVTQWSAAPTPPAPPPRGGKGPGVVYINPGFGSGNR